MPAYHSSLNDEDGQACCAVVVLPLKTLVKGPAPPAMSDQLDIVDEAIDFYRANVLFRSYDPKGPADRILCYLTIWIGECIRVLAKYPRDKKEGLKQLTTFSMNNFTVPGDRGFSLGGFFTVPKVRAEGDLFRAYFRQLREETAKRVFERVYKEDGTADKFWLSFGKKKFMNINTA
eukprot:TRINITY_DN171_c0_g1_i6.p1 TRINITY_DN171_c0_g1~~TRINITY_DN171_c0_g1_i6.p1  ORF type:complete len:176 (+),score=76.03 TRINITY_DN171_c0_g1_i6:74-601(+)